MGARFAPSDGLNAGGAETATGAGAGEEAAGAGARIAGAAAAGAAAAGAGARFIVPSDDTGGTAMTVVLLVAGGTVATGATPPGILIVGMPMIVADRGG